MTPETARGILLIFAGAVALMTLAVALRYAALPTRSHNVRHVAALGAGTVMILLYAMSVLYERLARGEGWSFWMAVFAAGLTLTVYGLFTITINLWGRR